MFSEIISFLLRNRGRRKGSREGNDVFWTERESKMGYKYKWEKPKRVKERFVCMEVRLRHVREAQVVDLWEGHLGIDIQTSQI
jgi:hypothetical protein